MGFVPKRLPLQDTGAEPLSGRYDFILGSDLLYDRDAPGLLADFIDEHAKQEAEVWIIDPNRGHRPAFNRNMAEYGFELAEEEHIEVPSDDAPAQLYKGRLLMYQRSSL